MGESNKTDVVSTRMRWNDIRVMGPLLVVALLMAAMVSPSFASAEQSVGGGGYYPYDCYGGKTVELPNRTINFFDDAEARVGTANLEADGPIRFKPLDCCFDGFPRAAAVAGVLISGDENGADRVPVTDPCCIDSGDAAMLGGAFISRKDCPPPVAALPVTGVNLTPPPPIVGPIWLGATVPVVADGSVHFKPPTLLAMMFDGNPVTITNEDGDVVFNGPVAPGSLIVTGISSVSGSGDYTLTSILKTGAKYTEVITVGTQS